MILSYNQLGSTWTDFRDKTISKGQDVAVKKFREKGVQVFIKTDLGKEFLVYDSADVSVNKKGKSFVQFGVKVKDRNGKILTSYGEYPPTSGIKRSLIFGGALLGAWVLYKGVKNFY